MLVSGPPYGYTYPPAIDGTTKVSLNGHRIPNIFDIKRQIFERENKNFRIGYPLIDTCALSFIFLPTERQNLNALREYFDIDTSRAHSSDTDVEDCRHVFYSIVNDTVGKMQRP